MNEWVITCSTALKFANALRHENYCLVIKGSAHSNYIESVAKKGNRYHQSQVPDCKFNGTRLCAYTRKTIPWY